MFPFQWDADNNSEQRTLLKESNLLGGRLDLDDTDKIKYSEVRTLLRAEAEFIKRTREAQSADLGRVMSEITDEEKAFRDGIRKELAEDRQAYRENFTSERQAAGIEARRQSLGGNDNEDAGSRRRRRWRWRY